MYGRVWKMIIELLARHRARITWTRILCVLASLVVFVTTYLMIMPVVTLSRKTVCAQEEHSHTEACYETETDLICGLEEHIHTETCHDEEGNLVCGLEEHFHGESCYETKKILVCGQEEHVHTDSCFVKEQDSAEETGSDALPPEEAAAASEEEESPDVPDPADPETDEEAAEDMDLLEEAEAQAGSLTCRAKDGSWTVTARYGKEAGVPAGAGLEVREILPESSSGGRASEYEEYEARTLDALGWETGSISYARFFDIRIVDRNGEKVEIAAPVDVSIELADKERGKAAKENTQVVHFADGAKTGDVIEELQVDGSAVSFEAEGFSAYAIVEGPEAIPVGWQKLSTLEELLSIGSTGVYLGHTKGYYFTNALTNDSNGRVGITKTKPSRSYPDETAAARYYFEKVPGTEDQVYAYCYADDQATKQYVYNGGNNSLSFTTDENKTAFKVTVKDGIFKFSNGSWYWNMQGGDNGTRFCSYNNANDVNNNINAWYFTTVDSEPYGLDGVTRGLIYWDEDPYGKALMAGAGSAGGLDAKALMTLATADNKKHMFVPNDSDISMWTFHWDHEDYYYLSTESGGSTKYLKIDAGGLSLVSSPEEAGPLQVIPGTGTHAGQICLKAGDTALTYSGNVETGFSTGGSVGMEWLNLVELSELTSDYFMTYSASKVSVSDESITTGSKVIVYTRAWNEETLKYEYYAIDHDGTLVRCYENGDSIEWVSSVINTMLWQFTDYRENDAPTYYYELFNEYAQKYLAPQVTDGQIVADDPVGINMNGRRAGQYYSTILAWDDENYSYAGLKVENGQIVSCPKSEAMDFYFAVMQDIQVDDDLTDVKTLDHTQYGISMKLVDFNSKIINGTGCTSTTEQHDVMGRTVYTETRVQPGLLSTDLTGGYPTAALTGQSLSTLFSREQEVNHLFIESTYNASGYFEFDSAQNFASLKTDTQDQDGIADFIVYKELGTYDDSNKPTLKHGQFLPYNDIEAGRFASVNRLNLYQTTGPSIPDRDPRKNEKLYLVKGKADLYFGVELEASFTQTPNGLDDWGHDIIFEFTGDDDFWLYVDGELVIDLGGIHSAVPGSVNFRTGVVDVNGTKTTLLDLFRDNYKKRNGITDNQDPVLRAYLEQYFDYDEGTGTFSSIFKEYSTHKMKIFYMERGGGASNLHMRFNLASVKPGTVELNKALDGVDTSESTLAEFAYQIRYKKKNDDTEYYLKNAGAQNPSAENYVFYKKTTNPVTFMDSKDIGGISYDNVFILKPGETVVIDFPAFGAENGEIESYAIVECGVNTEVFSQVRVNNGNETVLETPAGSSRKDYGIGYRSASDRPRVNYVNTVNPNALRRLTFSKKLFEADGTQEIHDDSTVFSFRLSFGTESDPELTLANMYTYHVLNTDGEYCRWDAPTQKFVSIGETDYALLPAAQKALVSFSTSMNGAIARIPVDYTVEVRQVLAGTRYKVQERPTEIPDGYSFQKYVLFPDSTDSDTKVELAGSDNGAAGAAGAIEIGRDPHVDVCNLKGWGLRANKIWTDADYMSGRETTYFAVYTMKHPDGHGHGYGQLDLVPGTLRAMPYGQNSLYWYWLTLPDNTVSFENYVVCEVRIEQGTPLVDEDGRVTNEEELNHIRWIREGESLTLSGRQKGESLDGSYPYTVRYDRGALSEESNVRVDTVTNDRPGILLKKQDWSGNPLAGAVFTLTEESSQVLIGTFTSDADGNITTAFLGEGKTYTLTETGTPGGYHGLEEALTIIAQNGTVTVNGSAADPEDGSYILTQARKEHGTVIPASLIIRNRPFTLKAVKQDGDTGRLLEGVHFALHKQITVNGVTSFDLNPLTGYGDLVTGPDGVIPGIDNTLPAGTYQLREKAALSGYKTLPGYIAFTVSRTGAVSLLSSEEWAGLAAAEGSDENGTLSYTMTILNHIDASVTIRKAYEDGRPLPGARFRLSKFGTVWESVPEYDEIDLTKAAEMTLSGLTVGRYRLTETHAPDGYVILSRHVYFEIGQDGTAVLTEEDGTPEVSYEGTAALYTANGNVLTVFNQAGEVLPAAGGPGTRLFTIFGAVLALAAGILLLRRRTS